MAAAPEFAPHAEVTGITIEYGTVDPITVLQSLRADAVLHAHGDPTAPEAAAIRAQVRAAFLDDDPAWLEALWPRYRSVVTAAVERLAWRGLCRGHAAARDAAHRHLGRPRPEGGGRRMAHGGAR